MKLPYLRITPAQLPHPPTASAITSAFYHNTKAGSQCFLPVGEGYAGLRNRDEHWHPPSVAGPSHGDKQPTMRGLVLEYIRTHHRFTVRQLVDEILAQYPAAKPHTLRAMLSHARKRGEVELHDDGVWQSMLFDSTVLSEDVNSDLGAATGNRGQCTPRK